MPCLALSLSLLASAAQAADTSATSAFPDLPYAKRWVFKPGSAGKSTRPGKPSRPSDGRTALFYNPICVSQDLPCNGEPGDYYNSGSGWYVVVDTVVELERVEVFGRSASQNAVCVGSECREYLQDLRTIYEESTGPVKAALWDLFRSSKLLEQCVPLGRNLVPPYDSLASEADVLPIARSFFLKSGVQTVVGDQFDTRQTNGTIVRYQVALISTEYGIGNVTFVSVVSGTDTSNRCR